MSLTRCAMDTVRGSPLERMVKRLGAIAVTNHRPMDNLGANEVKKIYFIFLVFVFSYMIMLLN